MRGKPQLDCAASPNDRTLVTHHVHNDGSWLPTRRDFDAMRHGMTVKVGDCKDAPLSMSIASTSTLPGKDLSPVWRVSIQRCLAALEDILRQVCCPEPVDPP